MLPLYILRPKYLHNCLTGHGWLAKQFKTTMKNLTLFLLIMVGFNSSNIPNFTEDFNIIGKWKSEDETGYMSFTFDSTGYAVIETEDRVIGEKRFEQKGMEFSLNYEIDYDTVPIQMDLTFTELKSGSQMVWPCIFKIISNKKILFARGTNNGQRPKDFNGSDYTILERIK